MFKWFKLSKLEKISYKNVRTYKTVYYFDSYSAILAQLFPVNKPLPCLSKIFDNCLHNTINIKKYLDQISIHLDLYSTFYIRKKLIQWLLNIINLFEVWKRFYTKHFIAIYLLEYIIAEMSNWTHMIMITWVMLYWKQCW